jgi:multidrug efflux pump subunit AcrB
MSDVRDKVAQVRPLFPRDVKDPLVVRADTENQEPVVSLAVMSKDTGLRELTSLTDQVIVKGLENVPGVARVDVNGRQVRQILIQVKPHALTALGIGVDQLITAVQNANQDVPAGRLTRGVTDSLVRIEGKIKDPAQFGRIIVAQQGGGPVYLSQVADVIDGEAEETSIARINGKRSITIDILKAQDANIVETGQGVVKAVEELRKRIPKDVELTVTFNSAETVEKSVNRVKSTILEGAALTVLIVFLFLHSWRSTIITIVAKTGFLMLTRVIHMIVRPCRRPWARARPATTWAPSRARARRPSGCRTSRRAPAPRRRARSGARRVRSSRHGGPA